MIPTLTDRVTRDGYTYDAPRVGVRGNRAGIGSILLSWPDLHLNVEHQFRVEDPAVPLQRTRGVFAEEVRDQLYTAFTSAEPPRTPRGLWVALDAVDWPAVADALAHEMGATLAESDQAEA